MTPEQLPSLSEGHVDFVGRVGEARREPLAEGKFCKAVVIDPDCPPNTRYILEPGATGTLASHPDIASHLEEGLTVEVFPSPEPTR